jgi:hypothetical protein
MIALVCIQPDLRTIAECYGRAGWKTEGHSEPVVLCVCQQGTGVHPCDLLQINCSNQKLNNPFV